MQEHAKYTKLDEQCAMFVKERDEYCNRAGTLDQTLAVEYNKVKHLDKDNAKFRRENASLMTEKERLSREKMEA